MNCDNENICVHGNDPAFYVEVNTLKSVEIKENNDLLVGGFVVGKATGGKGRLIEYINLNGVNDRLGLKVCCEGVKYLRKQK